MRDRDRIDRWDGRDEWEPEPLPAILPRPPRPVLPLDETDVTPDEDTPASVIVIDLI